LPQFAQTLALPEPADYDSDNLILLAIAKDNSAPLATMRIHTNHNKPLPLEQAVTLPDSIRSSKLAEAVRFSVASTHRSEGGSLPRDALFKAYYLACIALNIEWMVICARNPLHKLYLSLLFNDISPNDEPVTLPYAHNIPHRVLKLRVRDVEPLWHEVKHPLYHFFFNSCHPDLEMPLFQL
ncbi:MAG: hypothetical protein KF888_00810, partial [Nitrosomonas sp.]|nr:hypothetical protein [Nitrosomonas sp.]